MEGTEAVEPDEMSGRVLAIIGAYGVGAVLDPRRSRRKAAPAHTPATAFVDPAEDRGADVTGGSQIRRSA